MPFCANCGSEVQGKFCAKCGSPAAGAASPNPGQGVPPPPSQPQPQAAGYAPPAQASAGLDENIACALCYLLWVLTGVLFLVLEPYNRNRTIRFHAFQSIFAWLALTVCWIVVMIVASALRFVPFVGWLIYLAAWLVFVLGSIGLWLLLMYKAYNRERYVLPV